MDLFHDNADSDFDKDMHSRWVCHVALAQYNNGRGFLLTKERDDPFWENGRVQLLRNLPGVSFTPTSVCKSGLVVSEDDCCETGILTNVHEITHTVQSGSDALKKCKKRERRVK